MAQHRPIAAGGVEKNCADNAFFSAAYGVYDAVEAAKAQFVQMSSCIARAATQPAGYEASGAQCKAYCEAQKACLCSVIKLATNSLSSAIQGTVAAVCLPGPTWPTVCGQACPIAVEQIISRIASPPPSAPPSVPAPPSPPYEYCDVTLLEKSGDVLSGPYRFMSSAWSNTGSANPAPEHAYAADGSVFPTNTYVPFSDASAEENETCGVQLAGDCSKVLLGDADACDTFGVANPTCDGCEALAQGTTYPGNAEVNVGTDTCFPQSDPTIGPDGATDYSLSANDGRCVPFVLRNQPGCQA